MTRISQERAIWLVRHVLPHEPALRAWLRYRNLAGLEVDDVVQETYERLIKVASVEGINNPKTYAFQAAYSVVLNHLRRSKIVTIQAVANVEEFGPIAEEASPESQLADRDELQKLAESIARLPGKVRDVFTLRRVEGLSQREVALRLGISESTVEKRISKAFYLLHQMFTRGGKAAVDTSKTKDKERRTGHAQADRSRD